MASAVIVSWVSASLLLKRTASATDNFTKFAFSGCTPSAIWSAIRAAKTESLVSFNSFTCEESATFSAVTGKSSSYSHFAAAMFSSSASIPLSSKRLRTWFSTSEKSFSSDDGFSSPSTAPWTPALTLSGVRIVFSLSIKNFIAASEKERISDAISTACESFATFSSVTGRSLSNNRSITASGTLPSTANWAAFLLTASSFSRCFDTSRSTASCFSWRSFLILVTARSSWDEVYSSNGVPSSETAFASFPVIQRLIKSAGDICASSKGTIFCFCNCFASASVYTMWCFPASCTEQSIVAPTWIWEMPPSLASCTDTFFFSILSASSKVREIRLVEISIDFTLTF